MTYLAIALSIVLFCWSLRALRLVPASLDAVSTAREAAGVMRNPALEDDEKESRVQAAAVRLFRLFGTITLRTVAALAVPVVVLAVLAGVDLVSVPEVLDAALSWPVIAASTLAMGAALILWR